MYGKIKITAQVKVKLRVYESFLFLWD